MSKRPYRGAAGKSVWENRSFVDGVHYTDEHLNEGFLKMLCNWDISKLGGSIQTRDPFYNTIFKLEGQEDPQALPSDTFFFQSVQNIDRQYLINVGGPRPELKPIKLSWRHIIQPEDTYDDEKDLRVIDGDTFVCQGIRYRLLAIDTPEEGEPEFEAATNALRDLITNNDDEIYAVYDRNADTQVDSYGRHLIWLFVSDGTGPINTNLYMLGAGHAKLMGAHGDQDTLHFPKYVGADGFGVNYTDLDDPAYFNEKSVQFHNVTGGTINVYHKPEQTVLKPYNMGVEHETIDTVKIPYIDVDAFNNVDVSQLYNDLDVPLGIPLRIELNTQHYETSESTHTISTEYTPIKRFKDIDGFVMLGKVYNSDDEEIYRGLISVKYFIPLEGNKPQFDKSVFKVETYKENVFKVRFEDLNNRYNLNLLDPELPIRRDFIGEEAAEHNYFTYSIPNMAVFNLEKKPIVRLASGSNYIFRPYYVLPTIDEAEGYTGYAIKWDFFTETDTFQNKWIRFYSTRSDFPEEGSRDVVYTTLADSKYFIWDGNEYIEQNVPDPAITTGWRLTFDREGNPLTTYRGYDFIPMSSGILTGLKELNHPTSNFVNDAKIVTYNRGTMGNEQDGGSSGDIFYRHNSDLIPINAKDFILKIQVKYHGSSPIVVDLDEHRFDDPQSPVNRKLHIEFYDEAMNSLGTYPLHNNLTPHDTDPYFIFSSHLADIYNTQSELKDSKYIQIKNVMYIRSTQQDIYATVQLYQDDQGTLVGGLIPNVWDVDAINDLLAFDGSPTYNPVISLDNPIFDPIRHAFGSSMNVQVSIAPITIEDNKQVETPLELKAMSRIYAFTALIRDTEELEVHFQHGQNLHECRGITTYQDQVILYDSPKAPNVIYMSDVGGNLTYFPFRRALDQFLNRIVHIEPVQQGLIVFTTSDIYLVHPVIDTNENVIYRADVVYSNLAIKPHNRNTVRTAGKDILFMAEKSLFLLRPNPYVNDVTDMFLDEISKNIAGVLRNPTPHITRRYMYYGVVGDIFHDDWKPDVSYYTVVKNEEIWVYMSVKFPDHFAHQDPLMVIMIFDRSSRRRVWKFYDTQCAAYPYDHAIFDPNEGHQLLMKNHSNIPDGSTILFDESLNLDTFDEGYGRHLDIKPLKISHGQFVYNNTGTIEDIKQPVVPYFNTGFMNITPNLQKRFHKMYLELQNIDAYEIDVALEFSIDGQIRQTSNAARIQQITDPHHPGYGTLQNVHQFDHKYQFEPYAVVPNDYIEGGTSFKTWQLGMHKFAPANKLKFEFGVSGRGRSPALELGFKTSGRFKLFAIGTIFKEQTSR